ncbi:MAG: bifunctional aspartate kinase/diaminopimelate decarboxylase [Gammaproteobacteria bacterium]|nr:bifunctional aspartate kinase/diaminopimelate decarboxylase [Gammaproteobacteria bacterium]
MKSRQMQPFTESEFPAVNTLGAPADVCASRQIVMKFGGTSVTGAANWQIIAQLLRARLASGLQPLIVHSAFAGVSDLLEKISTGTQVTEAAQNIRDIHRAQATELALDANEILHAEFDFLAATEHDSRSGDTLAIDRVATILGLGELMSSRLSAAWLCKNGIDVTWIDAREWLVSQPQPHTTGRQQYLSAVCDYAVDRRLQDFLDDKTCVLTQGFIARNKDGNTVTLGRGGSDSSATFFGCKLLAQRVEIWTDVPGMFSADPRAVPAARALQALHFDEAQEIAAMGGTVLHPRCLAPAARAGIPVFVRSVMHPHMAGTSISKVTPEADARVKAIALRKGLKLLSLESVAMWQEVGFLADAFAIIKRFGVSVDLISTSESNVTLSIDPVSGNIAADEWHRLLTELGTICTVAVIEQCASVSLVGRNIRTMLHTMGPALEVFAEHKIHLVSQSASDLNLTFVVDENQGERLTQKLHNSIISGDTTHSTFGPSWSQLHQPAVQADRTPAWWEKKQNKLLALMQERECAYVYDSDTIGSRAQSLQTLSALDTTLYAMKANPHEGVLKVVRTAGLDFECVSPGELQRLFRLFPQIDRQRILYTPNFATREDYHFGLAAGVRVTLDNLYPLRHWGKDFTDRQVFIRLDPGHGRGHHELVRTAGSHSKFGIPAQELDELQQLVDRYRVTVAGIHAHSGSGIMDPHNWTDVGHVLSAAAARFDTVEVLDLGGGLGVPEKPGDPPLDLAALDTSLHKLKASYQQYRLWMEPGRFVVAEAGVLLARVTQTKGKGAVQYVGVATGMNSLIRPALYGAYHEIVNLSRLDEAPAERYTVVGPNCETGDRLGLDRLLPRCREGDILLIANTGAYGHTMSSRYNLREPAGEILL